MTDQDFVIHILNNLPELYIVVLYGMESRIILKDNDPNKLTFERFERIAENEKTEAE